MVTIELACVCDSANVSKRNKLNVIGVFDSISAENFPCLHPKLSIGVKLHQDPQDEGIEHKMSVVLLDQDNSVVWAGGEATLTPGAVAAEAVYGSSSFAIDVALLQFKAPGLFHFQVSISRSDTGEVVDTRKLRFRVSKKDGEA